MNPESSKWWKSEIIEESRSRDTRESIFGSSNISNTSYHNKVYSASLRLAEKVHRNDYITEREYNLILDFLLVHLESTTDTKYNSIYNSHIDKKLDMCCAKLASVCEQDR